MVKWDEMQPKPVETNYFFSFCLSIYQVTGLSLRHLLRWSTFQCTSKFLLYSPANKPSCFMLPPNAQTNFPLGHHATSPSQQALFKFSLFIQTSLNYSYLNLFYLSSVVWYELWQTVCVSPALNIICSLSMY